MDLTALLQQGNGWLFIPSAILLGILHGLEPGHSKTMMAAFIVSIKGTSRQAIMLGLAAAFSHTVIVWLIALGGIHLSQRFTAEAAEPWMQLISGVIIILTGSWMIWKTWREDSVRQNLHRHSSDWTKQIVDTGHGHIALSLIQETQHISRLQLKILKGKPFTAKQVKAQFTDPENQQPTEYGFLKGEGCLESTFPMEDTHHLSIKLMIEQHGHWHDYDVHFHEHAASSKSRQSTEYLDAHQRAHALDIEKRFTNRTVNNGQIVLFGLTGGLIPCPAAVTVLLICIQLKALTLGSTLVLSFSLGLALTLVSVGVIAAISVNKVTNKWQKLNDIAHKAPYFSGLLIGTVGLYMATHGYTSLSG